MMDDDGHGVATRMGTEIEEENRPKATVYTTNPAQHDLG